MPRASLSLIYGGSLLLHAGAALAVAVIPPEPVKREPTTITIREVKRKPEPPTVVEPPPPPPPAPEQRTPTPPVPRAEKKVKEAQTPPPADAPQAPVGPGADAPVADFGLALSGSVGPGGIAVPVRDHGQGPVHTPKETKPRALKPEKKTEEDTCIEALIKPKPIAVPQPVYSDQARENNIAGKVRVELSVDETGQVVGAKIIESLGYGLDEAALAAAKASRFEPATRCGKAVPTTFVIGIRFSL